MDSTELISELTYKSYKFNRNNSPEISYEKWSIIYGTKVHSMEARLIEESELKYQNMLAELVYKGLI